MAPQEAVDLAERYMEIARAGGDPKAVRDAEREAAGLKPVRSRAVVAEAAPAARTFRDAVRLYLAEFEDRWKDKNHAMQWAQTLRDYVYPVIGDVPLGEIGVDHIVRVLEPIWHTKHVTAISLSSSSSSRSISAIFWRALSRAFLSRARSCLMKASERVLFPHW